MARRPFDIVVITSPDAQSARSVLGLIKSSCGGDMELGEDSGKGGCFDADDLTFQTPDGTIYVSSCDPFGARLGSGGGTIAALSEADEIHSKLNGDGNNSRPTVLICHAGGESSRCPTQIVLGKAWTSLPVVDKMACTGVTNPTSILISGLSEVFADVPRGSVIVAASDVLLLFRSVGDDASSKKCEVINFDQVDHCKVLGLSVPAPLSTAKNHGVFVSDGTHCEGEGWNIQSTDKVLQKPSPDEMRSTANCTFSLDGGGKNQVAWIDTGVVCFLPKSAATLRDLSGSSMKCCTRTGIAELYGQGGTSHSSIEAFAVQKSIKLCLYGDMLRALKTASSQGPTGMTGTLAAVNKLSQHEICICSYSSGSFVHLGTTRELVDFLTVGASVAATSSRDVKPSAWKRYQNFGKTMKLTRRSGSFVSGLDTQADGHVVLNSVLTCSRGRLGANCVVEHCDLRSDEISIGENSLVSGVRDTGGVFSIGGDLCLQLLPVRQSWKDANLPASSDVARPCFVCLCFGINDGIKDFPMKTVYGVDLRALTRGFATANECGIISIKESEIWNENVPSSRRMLWNANMHPIIELDDKNELDLSWMSWINDLAQYGPGDESCSYAGFREWKSSYRVSLSDVRNVVDSSSESLFRGSIAAAVQACEEDRLRSWRRTCLGRFHEPMNFDHVRDVLLSKPSLGHDVVRRALRALDEIASEGIQAGKFDIAGRVFMVTGILLSDLSTRIAHGEEERHTSASNLQEALTVVLEDLRARSIDDTITSKIGALRDAVLSDPLQWASVRDDLAVFFEKAASVMTQLCVCGPSASSASSFSRVEPAPIGATVVASAPARIDLCGGWSDTPPISFEFGGSVACLAVLVDDKLPLRARCCVSREFQGIISLRTESRRLDNEELIASSTVELTKVSDLSDFREPTADAALLKCVLIQLGLISVESISKHNNATLLPHLARFCPKGCEGCGLEIVSTSLLPTGSGMGSSSILAGCILAAVAKCVGIRLKGVEDDCTDNGNGSLIHSVLMVEQLLSTGGGWQDNIGGLVGGLKLGRSDACAFPLHTNVNRCNIPPETIELLNRRLVLAFSGKPRLAKNVLDQVLRRWASRQPEIVQTVSQLVEGAPLAISFLESGDIDGLASVMSNYWNLKIQMAGQGSGVQPDSICDLLELLDAAGDIAGGTVCGAGGGKGNCDVLWLCIPPTL
ncbi:hypothetical protein THAOC_11109 [Thalassiosira oceanica]|uniref:Uncharacterized protein n=1 Tax=Thalassiosira oceanica TaxID=159749 RepID=K0T387_THAOC|nr:hypothetical protein THAOC_11109 [Thalassiosira oceanica]|eukprot:EJK67806.1 hypothetical protein THAOC_11109 [Thalassiosira oceanica]